MNGLQIAGAVGIGLAAGAGALFASKNVFDDLRERTIEGRYAEELDGKADLAPGAEWTPYPGLTDARGYSDVFLPVMGVMAGVGASIGAGSLISGGKTIPGIGAAAGAGLLLGSVVGGIWGGTEGSRRAAARHGIEIDPQVREVIATWDANRNGTIEIDDTGRGYPEFLRRNPDGADYYTGAQDWLTVEEAMKRADTSGDKVVDAGEIETLLESYDANGDGRLQESEATAFSDAGNEYRLLAEVI